MVQIYSPSNTNYDQNGDCVLWPSRCELAAELNGAWSLQLEHPIDDDGRWNYIVENAVLKVPTWMSTKYQRYRIRVVEKTETTVMATAYPVFFDSRDDAYIFDIRISNKTAQQALTLLLAAAPSKYTATSNLIGNQSEVFQNCNLLEAITGKFLDRWGGEILYNNNQLIINQTIGGDYGVTVEYGKNITGTTYNIDMTDVSTRLIPYAYNARQMSGDEPWVDSPIKNSYPKLFIRTVQLEDVKLAEDASDDDSEDESITICETQAELDAKLRELCNKMYAEGADKPKISMSIDMLALENTDEYAGFEGLEEIGLGDTVHCKHSKLGIVSDAKVVGIVWDCARDRIASVTLGDFAYDYLKDNGISDIMTSLQEMAQNFNSDGSIMAERIKGLLNGMNVQLNAQYTAAKKQDVMAILFENLDPESPLYGALGIGTQGFQISKTRTADGKGWEWTTAATANGFVADTVVTGTLSDKAAYSYWNLETGEMKIGVAVKLSSTGVLEIQAKDKDGKETFYLNSGTGVVRLNCTEFSLSGSSIASIATDAVNNAFNKYDPADGLTQQEIFNILTGGTKSSAGPEQGVWLKDGRLYLRWTYAEGGQLKLGGKDNGNGELELYSSADVKIATINNTGAEFFQTAVDLLTKTWTKISGNGITFTVTNQKTGYSYDVCDLYPNVLITSSDGSQQEYYMGFACPEKGFLFQKKAWNRSTGRFDYTNLLDLLETVATFYKAVTFLNGITVSSGGITINGGYLDIRSSINNMSINAAGNIYGSNFPASDIRLKENIRPVDTDIIDQLNTVQFDWKKDGSHASAGFIAQEVREICPELVCEGKDGILGLSYEGIVPHLVHKVQQQEKRLQAQEKHLKKLEDRIAALERR